MSGGQKNATTSLEIAVSVVNDPHQIFVRRACKFMFVAAEWFSTREGAKERGGKQLCFLSLVNELMEALDCGSCCVATTLPT